MLWLEEVAQGDGDSCPRRKIWPLCPKSSVESVKSICLSFSMSLLILWLGESAKKKSSDESCCCFFSLPEISLTCGLEEKKKKKKVKKNVKRKKNKCMFLLWELRKTKQGLGVFYWHPRMPLIKNHNFELSWSGFVFSSKPLDWFLPERSKFQTP